MVILSKKFGQLKQWTGEKFGSTNRTHKSTEVKQLQVETKSRFDGIQNIRSYLKEYARNLDECKNSPMAQLAGSVSAHAYFHEKNDFGTLLLALGSGIGEINQFQNEFAGDIRGNIVLSLEDLLAASREFDHLKKKLKNRRLDYDANNNKLQKGRREDPALEETVRSTRLKYEETLHVLEETMTQVVRKEQELIEPFIEFIRSQINFYQSSLKTSHNLLQLLLEGKNDLKTVDLVAESFRRELEEEAFNSSESLVELDNSNNDVVKVSREIQPAEKKKAAKSIDPVLKTVVAKFNFEAENDGEISLWKGDVIKVTRFVDDGWWVGTCNGTSGMFPSNYVAELEPEKAENDTGFTADELEKLDIADNASKTLNNSSNGGFSYIPKGVPLSFIGRKASQGKSESASSESMSISSCHDCGCDDYSVNVFKPGHCNNCFHKH